MKKITIYLVSYSIIVALAYLDNRTSSVEKATAFDCLIVAAVVWFIIYKVTNGFGQKDT